MDVVFQLARVGEVAIGPGTLDKRRTLAFPAFVMPVRWTFSPVERSPGTSPK
jgi:hypothetical protein